MKPYRLIFVSLKLQALLNEGRMKLHGAVDGMGHREQEGECGLAHRVPARRQQI
jgi:hypothetical protein